MNTQKLTIITAVIAGLLALGGYFFIQNNKPVEEQIIVGNINLTGQPALGQKDAPIKVVVFEDFSCVHCKYFEEGTLPKMKADYIDNGDVEFYFVNFAFINEGSTKAALATECVLEQSLDAFWEYKTILFRSQVEGRDWATLDVLVNLAEEYVPDVDSAKLRTCISERQYADDIKTDLEIGRAAGVNGTPAVFVNGKSVANYSYPAVKEAIEAELKK